MSQIAQKWLLVQWNSGSRDVIHADAVDTPEDELSIGCRLTVSHRGEAEPRVGTLIDRSRSRSVLNTPAMGEVAGPSSKPDDEGEDYSPSCSSWSPSQEEESTDSEEENARKKVKLNHCSSNILSQKCATRRTKTPTHCANQITPQERDRTVTGANRENMKMLRIPNREIINMQLRFNVLFKLLSDMTNAGTPTSTQEETKKDGSRVNIATRKANEITKKSGKENLKRTNDNVIMTNKNKKNESIDPVENQGAATDKSLYLVCADKKNDEKEWVPIGSGLTTLHIDRYRKVKWQSYTAATRTLLMAAFDRRVLATHSLTGKPSPAFKNKPGKMCLDQQITSDIINEVTKRFDVKENLVRSIITTKCADECKMWRQRQRKQSDTSTGYPSNQENEPPAAGAESSPQSFDNV